MLQNTTEKLGVFPAQFMSDFLFKTDVTGCWKFRSENVFPYFLQSFKDFNISLTLEQSVVAFPYCIPLSTGSFHWVLITLENHLPTDENTFAELLIYDTYYDRWLKDEIDTLHRYKKDNTSINIKIMYFIFRRMGKILQKYLRKKIQTKRVALDHEDAFLLSETDTKIPFQRNLFDCGIFLCMIAKALARYTTS